MSAKIIRKRILKQEIRDLSKLMNIDEEILFTMQHLLNIHNVKTLLMEDEFNILTKEGKLKASEILEKLAKKYRLSRASVEAAVYIKNKKDYKCTKCNVEITKYKFIRCDEMCNECYKIKSHE